MFSRPPAFVYQNDQLHCERLPLSKLASRYGTPLYVYSAAAIRERYRAFDGAFRDTPHTVCYSVKANSNLSILRLLAKLGAGFDIVSGGELERVLAAQKSAAKKTVFSGVGKTADEMDLALRADILLFNVESEEEIELLAERAAKKKKTPSLALRVNPDVPAETHPYISTGLREHKFGVPLALARDLYRQAAQHRNLRVEGVSLHIGSQITEVTPFAASMERVTRLVEQLIADGHPIRFVDAGGGLGISYSGSTPEELARSAQRYANAVTQPLRQVKAKLHLLLEPGRFIVGPAGALVTRVLFHKQNGSKRFVIVDAAMNDLLRPSLYGAKHEITPVNVPSSERRMFLSDIAGPICETGDFLARDIEVPHVPAGEYLCVLDTGAYGMSLASNYNTRPRAAEVLVDGAKAKLIRRREKLREMLQPERSCL